MTAITLAAQVIGIVVVVLLGASALYLFAEFIGAVLG